MAAATVDFPPQFKRIDEDMEEHALHFSFTPDPRGQGYRAFYLPIKYRYDATFEWIEAG